MNKKDVDSIVKLWRDQRIILNKSLDLDIYSHSVDINNNTTGCIASITSPKHQLDFLCQRLMDYISVGHFEIYEKLLQESKQLASEKLVLVKGIYHNIEHSTDQALNFNDKYDCDDNFVVAEEKALPYDLEKLNRSMAIRFVLEEKLIEIVYN